MNTNCQENHLIFIILTKIYRLYDLFSKERINKKNLSQKWLSLLTMRTSSLDHTVMAVKNGAGYVSPSGIKTAIAECFIYIKKVSFHCFQSYRGQECSQLSPLKNIFHATEPLPVGHINVVRSNAQQMLNE